MLVSVCVCPPGVGEKSQKGFLGPHVSQLSLIHPGVQQTCLAPSPPCPPWSRKGSENEEDLSLTVWGGAWLSVHLFLVCMTAAAQPYWLLGWQSSCSHILRR